MDRSINRRLATLEARLGGGATMYGVLFTDTGEVLVFGTHERLASLAEFRVRYPGGVIVKQLVRALWEALP